MNFFAGFPYLYRAHDYGYNQPVYRYGRVGKRSADAEAGPQILGYPGLVGGVYAGLVTHHTTQHVINHAPHNYAGLPLAGLPVVAAAAPAAVEDAE